MAIHAFSHILREGFYLISLTFVGFQSLLKTISTLCFSPEFLKDSDGQTAAAAATSLIIKHVHMLFTGQESGISR